jgi:hypothetical protein
MAKNRRFIGPLEKLVMEMKIALLQVLVCLFPVLCQLFNKFWEKIDFEILRSELMLRLCDDWCCHKNFSLTFDLTRLRLGLFWKVVYKLLEKINQIKYYDFLEPHLSDDHPLKEVIVADFSCFRCGFWLN